MNLCTSAHDETGRETEVFRKECEHVGTSMEKKMLEKGTQHVSCNFMVVWSQISSHVQIGNPRVIYKSTIQQWVIQKQGKYDTRIEIT